MRAFAAVKALALALLLAAAALPALAPEPVRAAPVPGSGCQVFPSDNVWNTDISTLPVNAKSSTWLANMNPGVNLHPDFGPPGYGIPFNVVDGTHATQMFQFDYADESDNVPYPFGPDISIEGGPGVSSGDGHALIVNKDTCTLYEIYQAYRSPQAGSGAVFNLGSDALRPAGWTSADAAGLPIFAGLVRYDEVAAGAINHAIRFTAHATDCSYLWPARHEAGTCDSSLPPMGARFRLKASFDISGYSPAAQVVLRAFQRYGLILADNGSDWYFQGSVDPGWQDSFISELKTVPAAQFEAVDESSLMVSPDSGQAVQPKPFVPPPAGTVQAQAPVRVLDTRPATRVGSRSTPLGAGETYSFAPAGLPPGASAAVLNVTATGTTSAGFLTVFPAGTQRPTASNLNWSSGQTVANQVIAPLGAGGAVSLYNSSGQTDVVADLGGYVLSGDTGAAGRYEPLTPARIADSRPASQVGDYATPLTAGTVRKIQVGGRGGVPATGVAAVVLNLTATDTSASAYLTAWPDGAARPVASNLNWLPGQTVANRAIVKLGAGAVDLYTPLGSADVVLDVGGWLSDSSAGGAGSLYTPVAPVRILDTRPASGPIGPYSTPFGQGQSRQVAVAGRSGLPASGLRAVAANLTVTNPSAPGFLTAYPDDLSTPPLISDLDFAAGQTVPALALTRLGGADGGLDLYNLAGSADVIVDVLGYFS